MGWVGKKTKKKFMQGKMSRKKISAKEVIWIGNLEKERNSRGQGLKKCTVKPSTQGCFLLSQYIFEKIFHT